MAQDFLPCEESRQIVPPAWTKLVTKAGDIVRHKANVKVSSPLAKDRIDMILDYSRFNSGNERDVLPQDLEFAEEPLEMSPHLLLAQRLESVLREAKETCLHCEVLVPCDLTTRIARDIIHMSELEPCGLRGCLVYIHLEDGKGTKRRVGKLKCDRDTVPTFELSLTLQRDSGNWLSLKQLIPGRLLKRIGRSPALIVSEAFTISKKKLYRSSSLD